MQKHHIRLELIWWVFTAIVVVGVMIPIFQKTDHYPFTTHNIIFIVVFITLSRYIFLLKHTWLAQKQKLKLGIILVSLPLIFMLINALNSFQSFADDIGLDTIFNSISPTQQATIINFVKSEMTFFGVGAIIAMIVFPFRMLLSIWRIRNRGTV